MRKVKRKLLWALVVMAALAAALLLVHAARATRVTGHLKLTVVDAYSNRIVEGAQIVLPEAGLSAVSDTHGNAYVYGVPLRAEPGALGKIESDYGETTILVYAQGYLPFALFHAHVYPNRIRNGPTLYLFPVGEEGMEAISMIESPAEDWVKRLLAAYAP